MKCFYHHDRDAFGICQACGKGLCLECMDTSNNITKCKNSPSCKEKVRLLNISYNNIRSTFTKGQKIISIFVGLLFFISGLAGLFIAPIVDDNFMIVPCIIFVVIGFAILFSARRIRTN